MSQQFPSEKISYELFCKKMLLGNEFELEIYRNRFFLGCVLDKKHSGAIYTVENISEGRTINFPSRQHLIEKFRFHGKTLQQLWPDVIILDII